MVCVKKKSIAMSRIGDLFCDHQDFPLIYHLKEESFAYGKWQDIIMHIGFHKDAERGFMKVYANGKRRVNFKGSMYDDIIEKAGIKVGISNTFVKSGVIEVLGRCILTLWAWGFRVMKLQVK